MNKINTKITNLNIKNIHESFFNINKLINEKTKNIELLNEIINQKNQSIQAINQSTSWKITLPLRYISNKLGLKKNSKLNVTSLENQENSFQKWIAKNNFISKADRDVMQKKIKDWSSEQKKLPLISIVMPTFNPNINWFIEAIESVRAQTYPHWQLCIADDASTNPEVVKLLESYRKKDLRIEFISRQKNGHISAASNTALELVKGEWVALLDHDDLITEDALFYIALNIIKNPNVKLLYSDEAKTNENNQLLDPYFKSDWNIDLFYGHNMISHLGVYKTELIRKINGFRIDYEGAQDYDLALRYIEQIKSSEITHIAKILYFWRIHSNSTAGSGDAKPYAEVAGVKALNDHFKRCNVPATATSSKYGFLTHYKIVNPLPSATIIIRFPISYCYVSVFMTINDIIQNTNYDNFKILVVSGNQNLQKELLLTQNHDKIDFLIVNEETDLNSPQLLQQVVERSNNQVLVFFDPNVYLKNSNWLEVLISNAVRPEIGAVGPKLFYPNDTVYSTGLVLGLNNFAGCLYKDKDANYRGHMSKAQLAQNISAVSIKCLAVEKRKLLLTGAIDVKLNFNFLQEVNLCLTLSSHSYRTLWTPLSEVYYSETNLFTPNIIENNEDNNAILNSQIDYLKQKWVNYFKNDPFYNPNLCLDNDNSSIATQSRFLKDY